MGTRQGLYALVLSDQAILRAALVALLRSQSSIVEIGQAATVDEAMQAPTSGRDVILAAETRASATIAIVAELAERGCRMPVLAIAYDDSAMFVRRVLSAGPAL
jgi:DNA-binding NarL/FixJ family response regulator